MNVVGGEPRLTSVAAGSPTWTDARREFQATEQPQLFGYNPVTELNLLRTGSRGALRMTGRDVPVAESGEALLVSHLDLVERVTAFTCARNRLSPADADDFASHVKLRLVEDDYAILRRFQGRSSLRTYLTVVIQRLFLDFRIQAWGKWRPSAEARRSGPVGVLLERLIVRDGHTFDEACQLLATNHGVAANRAELERLAGRFPVRVKRRFESEEALADAPAPGGGPDQTLAQDDARRDAGRVSQVLNMLTANLETQDRLILTMRFEDGRTVAEIAATLGLEQKRLYRRIDKLLRSLRDGFEAAGVDSTMVQDILASPAGDVDWDETPRGKSTPRPSMEAGAPQWR